MKNTFKKVEINPTTISDEELRELREEILVRNGKARFYSLLESKILVIHTRAKTRKKLLYLTYLAR